MYLKPIHFSDPETKAIYKERLVELFTDTHLKALFLECLTLGEVFILGGFLRDVINMKPNRDLDLIVSLTQNQLDSIITSLYTSNTYKKNRLGGYKIQISPYFNVDIWTVSSSWNIKNKSLKISRDFTIRKENERYWLDKIAEIPFFNFDSLVLSVRTLNSNFKKYNSCVESNTLDLVKHSSHFIHKNPTPEANVLRAIYLQKEFSLEFSYELKTYIYTYLRSLGWIKENINEHMNGVLNNYNKYSNVLEDTNLNDFMRALKY
ncbi:hypothetical protein [uncultured Roseivirga sp.]|uniref:hypothetical protein n=1 Tax=uncultured Roseivirga sp. TaxID=543088 RepID=UPI000D7A080C|nr:hypothetical protein [uncultured Roseivirga sp.]PWL29316.1 MAG: hypothetical protein DCO95_12840 [Roseivirga sp. XM-24bin3]